jgi:hypothetical protein
MSDGRTRGSLSTSRRFWLFVRASNSVKSLVGGERSDRSRKPAREERKDPSAAELGHRITLAGAEHLVVGPRHVEMRVHLQERFIDLGVEKRKDHEDEVRVLGDPGHLEGHLYPLHALGKDVGTSLRRRDQEQRRDRDDRREDRESGRYARTDSHLTPLRGQADGTQYVKES